MRLEVSLDLASRLPAGAVRVSESGIETAEDIVQSAGCRVPRLSYRGVADAAA